MNTLEYAEDIFFRSCIFLDCARYNQLEKFFSYFSNTRLETFNHHINHHLNMRRLNAAHKQRKKFNPFLVNP